ncbi:hypothetical protein VZT92_018517 [Zoarces viviparus]|uniref:Uncharacterized protein n=1 Tax=Zoarces viviparus TaxID=48416 RepID=A0AAW1EH25_ZOAVI
MNRFLRAGENGGLLTDCRELSPDHPASSSSSITSSSSAAGPADRHAALPSLQTRGPVGGGSGGSEPRRSALKRSRAGREGREEPEAAEHSAAAGEVSVGKQQQQQRREAQGRSVGGEAVEMISAVSRDADGGGSGLIIINNNNNNNNNGVSDVPAASPATCAKGKEERKGKNVIRGWKRDRDRERDAAAPPPARTRKEKPGDGSSPPPPPPPPSAVFLPSCALPEHPLCPNGAGHCHCAAQDSGIPGDNGHINTVGSSGSNNALDCGVKSGGGAIVVRRQHDDTPAAKKHRGAEKVSSSYCLEANHKHTNINKRISNTAEQTDVSSHTFRRTFKLANVTAEEM